MSHQESDGRIDFLLSEGASALKSADWHSAFEKAGQIQLLDPGNPDAKLLREFAESGLHPAEPRLDTLELLTEFSAGTPTPDSFGNGRYAVRRFLGEDTKKRAFLVYDTAIGVEAVLLLIKPQHWEGAARLRVLREAQALAGAGAASDMGEDAGQPYVVLTVVDAPYR